MSPILVIITDPEGVAICACVISLVANAGLKRVVSLDREDLFAAVFPVVLARNIAPFTHRKGLVWVHSSPAHVHFLHGGWAI